MISAIRHIGLVVRDLDKALDFWCETMGFKVTVSKNESGPHIDAMIGLTDVKVKTVKLAAPDGNLLELLHFISHPDKDQWEGAPNSTGITHIAFTVDNVNECIQRLKLAGVSFPAEPQLSPDGDVKAIYAKGPEGVLLELVELIR